jgi:hypothetical protein
MTGRILMTDFARLLETKIPNLRRYARAPIREVGLTEAQATATLAQPRYQLD